MSKRLTLAAVAAAVAVVAMPVASEAGHKRAVRAERPACALTAMLHMPRMHVRRERPDWLKALFNRDRGHHRVGRHGRK